MAKKDPTDLSVEEKLKTLYQNEHCEVNFPSKYRTLKTRLKV